MSADRLRQIQDGQDRSLAGSACRVALGGVAGAYQAAVGSRNRLFDHGWRKIHRLPRPAISLGNITTGGTGKTPTTLWLAQRLLEAGHHPAVLLRGYKAGKGESDEATLYREAMAGTGVAVAANPDRVAGAQQAMKNAPATDVFLLDDGFQHRKVHRDLDLVLLDATDPLGGGHLLPRGRLREPGENLRRADGILITRAETTTDTELNALDDRLNRLTGQRATAWCAHHWQSVMSPEGKQAVAALGQQRVAGLCGIGNPAAFERELRRVSREVVWFQALPDHAQLPPAVRLAVHLAEAKRAGATALILTEKDWVRWRDVFSKLDPLPLPIWRVQLDLNWRHGEEALWHMVKDAVGEAAQ
jgi:tetraacyldisaccharide 4'-kinase